MSREVLVDARWQEPCEPMDRVMVALDLLRPDEHIRFLIHREPVPLYPILVERGFVFSVSAMDDGCFELLIEPAARPA